jgi:hypothetical protein
MSVLVFYGCAEYSCMDNVNNVMPSIKINTINVNDTLYNANNFNFQLITPQKNYYNTSNTINELPFIIDVNEMVFIIKRNEQVLDTMTINFNTDYKFVKARDSHCDSDRFGPHIILQKISFKNGVVKTLTYYINEE